jgi:hypothetical protein
MPEPDPRHARLSELRQRLDALGLKVNTAPVGSPERDRLAEQFGEVLACVFALGGCRNSGPSERHPAAPASVGKCPRHLGRSLGRSDDSGWSPLPSLRSESALIAHQLPFHASASRELSRLARRIRL